MSLLENQEIVSEDTEAKVIRHARLADRIMTGVFSFAGWFMLLFLILLTGYILI